MDNSRMKMSSGLSKGVHEGGTDTGFPQSSKDGDIITEKGGPAATQSEPERHEVSAQKEDLFAWLQVIGAFALNLNTW